MNIKFSLGNGQVGEGTLCGILDHDFGTVDVLLSKQWDDFPVGTMLTINFSDILPSPVEYPDDVEVDEMMECDVFTLGIPEKSTESNERYSSKWSLLDEIKSSIGSLKPSFCFE